MSIAKPLIQLREESLTFQWSLKKSLYMTLQWPLKKSLCMTPILGCIWPGEWFIVDMVMRSTRIGDKLPQIQEGQKFVAAYCSWTLVSG
jgi:hypothetical protein